MTIRALRILPPLAFARLGSSPEPLANYTLEDDPDHPLGYRRIKGAETLIVDQKNGEIRKRVTPATVTFRDDEGRIRPVAPFLEVFAELDDGKLVPLDLALLKRHQAGPGSVSWRVAVANRKVVRRTGDDADLVAADTGWFTGHDTQRLAGHCKNFVSRKSSIDFGSARYIRPSAKFPQIRLRFHPATGLIYGPSRPRGEPTAPIAPSRGVYDPKREWVGFDGEDHDQKGRPRWVNETVPPALYAIEPPAPSWLNDNIAISRGYLDDACDGLIEVRLTLPGGRKLTAAARVAAGPPALVPDALFVRNLADDLEQVIFGPDVPDDEPHEVTRARAEDIVRRAAETVRFMNVAVMNGNDFQHRDSLLLDSMPEEEAADTERAIRPVMAAGSVDTFAVLALHEQALAAIRAGSAPWFVRILRRPDEVTDYTDMGRRKMPALMCGADNSYLALTWRQIDTIARAAQQGLFASPPDAAAPTSSPPPRATGLTPRNLSAQIHYAARGNPISSRPVVAVANCCPGLEVDFRAVWRRLFEGIVLREHDNLVVDIDPGLKDPRKRALKGHRLLRVDGVPVMAEMKGPAASDEAGAIVLTTDLNPYGLAPLEWSNALARVLHEFKGRKVRCDFSKEESWNQQVPFIEDPPNYVSIDFTVRPFFEDDTAVISRALAAPGELTQGLCSPWQNDYRECSCYYWASARPDYVNVEAGPDGLSTGDNWLQKERSGTYVPDDYRDARLIMYDELFEEWERWLRFQIGGRDAPGEPV